MEIQFSSQYDYFQRMLYGVSKTITEHLKIRSDYGNIVKVYSVNIIYFDLGVLDEWIYFLKNEEIKSNFKAQGLDKAKETLDIMQLKEEERLKYQRYIGRRRDEKSFVITKEIELEEAREKGIEEGIEKEIAKGKKDREIEIAKSLLDILDIDTIGIVKGFQKLKSVVMLHNLLFL